MADNEQQLQVQTESSEVGEQIANAAGPKSEEGLVATNGSVDLNDEHDAQPVESHMDNQQNQVSDLDKQGQDVSAESSSLTQNLDAGPLDQDPSSRVPDPVDTSPDHGTNIEPSNQDSDSAMPQGQDEQPPVTQDSIESQSEQEPNSRHPAAASQPPDLEETVEESMGVDNQDEPDSTEPDQNAQDTSSATEDVGEKPEETVQSNDELQQSSAAGGEQVVSEDNANGPPTTDTKPDEEATEDLPGDDPADASSTSQSPPIQEEGAADIEEGAPVDADDSNRVSPSPQPLTQEQTVVDTADGTAADAVNDSNETPSSPQQPDQDAPMADQTPASLQQNNSNESGESQHFVGGSVYIPTADAGDNEESQSNRGSRSDLRDPAMYKMRSSQPMDARGDSNSHHLPALIHPDPRLARSLPATLGHIDDVHNGYQRGSHRAHGHIPRLPSASESTKADTREGDVRRALTSAKLPPSVMKMSTVLVSARKRAVLNRNASVFYEKRQHRKVISLDEAINSRPPMPFDLDGPGPWSYSPRNKPLHEDNSPEYTFGHKFNEKDGGGRTAYAKTWFNSKNGFTQKVHYEKRWPSPAHYNNTRSLLGRRKPTMLDYPSFTIGVRSNFSISKRGAENEPAPNEYNRSKSDAAILRNAPSYSMTHRHRGTELWSGNETTPGPGTYNPRWGHSSSTVHHPSFTIQGVRRLKSHQLGPHSTF